MITGKIKWFSDALAQSVISSVSENLLPKNNASVLWQPFWQRFSKDLSRSFEMTVERISPEISIRYSSVS
jgi:hypothetical protein